jgi:hypothetical protein
LTAWVVDCRLVSELQRALSLQDIVLLSPIGLVVSLWVHRGAVVGRRVAPETFFWMLQVGIFVVWFPTVFVGQRLVGNVNRKDLWKVVLKDSPGWMRYMVYGFFGYAAVNLSLFMTKAPQWRGWAKSASASLEGILRPLDGVLFGCACHPVFGCSYRGYKPSLCQRVSGISQRDLLSSMWSTCAARSLKLTQSRWQLNASQPTRSPQVSGFVAQYISTQREKYSPGAIPLSAQQKATIDGFFSPGLLAGTRLLLLRGERVGNPDFYPMLRSFGFKNLPDQSTMGAITFSDVVVSHEPFSIGLLFHELVHVEQYRQLGIPRFSEFYVRGFLNGGSYQAIPLEVNAYTLGGRFESDPRRMFSVEDEVGRWAAEGRF